MSEGGRPVRVAINGLGRIGRAFLRVAISRPELLVVAANDLGGLDNLAYLLKYDSVYGRSPLEISVRAGYLKIADRSIKFLQEREPAKLPWRDLQIDVVVESTGFFTTYEAARAHLDAGSRKVVISAPVKGESTPGVAGATVLLGVNEDRLAACQISSNASCTTNAASPVLQIMSETVGVEKAVLNTVHGYTASQKLVDAPDDRDFRRGRAAGVNIIPSTTGAAEALTEAMTNLRDLFDGIAIRVPVLTGSLADITFIAKRRTSSEEINEILRQAAKEERWREIFATTEEPLVSSDIIASPYGSVADLTLTKVVGGNLVKILAWYDNEVGYAHTLVLHVIRAGRNY